MYFHLIFREKGGMAAHCPRGNILVSRTSEGGEMGKCDRCEIYTLSECAQNAANSQPDDCKGET